MNLLLPMKLIYLSILFRNDHSISQTVINTLRQIHSISLYPRELTKSILMNLCSGGLSCLCLLDM